MLPAVLFSYIYNEDVKTHYVSSGAASVYSCTVLCTCYTRISLIIYILTSDHLVPTIHISSLTTPNPNLLSLAHCVRIVTRLTCYTHNEPHGRWKRTWCPRQAFKLCAPLTPIIKNSQKFKCIDCIWSESNVRFSPVIMCSYICQLQIQWLFVNYLFMLSKHVDLSDLLVTD